MATFNGVTFEERTVRSLDDARINNALFSNGILTGCALTYSGKNLTIAKGALMVKGREIAVDNNETIASSPTYTNGYGRLKYVINLAAAASSSTFTQGATVWQYASTNSFAALTQQDINDGTSTTYEVEICRVKYTSGSITSIESKIAAYGFQDITMRNASGAQRVALLAEETDTVDVATLRLLDATGVGTLLGTQPGTGGDKYRGLWLYDSAGIASHYGHNATAGNTYLWMEQGDGSSSTKQIYIETTSTGGKITLRGETGVLAAEIVFDPTAGGQIKLYNASGVLKQTIG